MSVEKLILNHDKWRKRVGGALAGVTGESDGNAYTGLDLNLIAFACSTFSGSSFASTTFKQAEWTTCQFTKCAFSTCDFEGIVVTGCTFTNCTFAKSQFCGSRLTACKFNLCNWDDLNFDSAHWSGVDVLDCTGTRVKAIDLRGKQVDFAGSSFERTEFRNARIN